MFRQRFSPHLRCFLFPAFLAVLAFATGCAGPRVRVGDDLVEKPLQEATGITSEAVRQAESKAQLGFWDAYALSVEHTERLASRYENLEQAKAERQQAVGAYAPHVYLDSSKGIWGPTANSSGVSLYFHGTQNILTGMNEIAAIQGAKSLIHQREDELRFDAQRLLLDVARSYYGVLQLEESLRSEQTNNDLSQKMLKEQRLFRSQGRIRQSDVLSAEAQLAGSDANLVAIQDDLEQARQQLALLTGMEETRPLAGEDPASFPEVPLSLDSALKQASQRPDVLAAEANLKYEKSLLLAAEGGFAPTLSAQGDVILHRQGNPLNAPKWDAYLNASLPIFTGGQTLGKIREAKSRVRQAELQSRQTLRTAREEIRQAFTAYQNAVKQDTAYQSALQASEKSHQAQAEDYRLRLTNIVEYLQSQNSLEQARLNAARSRYQWRIQRVWLGVATGAWPKGRAESQNAEAKP